MNEEKFEPQDEYMKTNGYRSQLGVEKRITELATPGSEGATWTGDPAPRSPSEGVPALSPSPGFAETMPTRAPGASETPAEKPTSLLREYFESIIITLIIALFITTFILQAYKIPTGSMESNLLIGDHLLVNKFVFSRNPAQGFRILPYKEIKRGDVLVFKFPENPEQAFVKRVIGLPGDKVTIIEKEVQINGEPLDEVYTQFTAPESAYRPTYMEWTVPPDSYFVMGDNRDNSRDSREWSFVPQDYIIGKPMLIYWSFETEPNEHQRTALEDRKEQIKDVIVNFFSKTRWDRTFKMVK